LTHLIEHSLTIPYFFLINGKICARDMEGGCDSKQCVAPTE